MPPMDCAGCFSSAPVRSRREKLRPPPLVHLQDRSRSPLARPPTPYPSQFMRPAPRHKLPKHRPVRVHQVVTVTVTVRRPSTRATIIDIPPPEQSRSPRSTVPRRCSVRTPKVAVVPKSPSREERRRESIRLEIARHNAEINARPPLPFSARGARGARDDLPTSFSGLSLGHGARK